MVRLGGHDAKLADDVVTVNAATRMLGDDHVSHASRSPIFSSADEVLARAVSPYQRDDPDNAPRRVVDVGVLADARG